MTTRLPYTTQPPALPPFPHATFRCAGVAILMCSFLSFTAAAGIPLTMTDLPTDPNSYITGFIGPVPDNDPTPNPCSGAAGRCVVVGFAVSGTWHNKYRGSYPTDDTINDTEWNDCFSAAANKTIGQVGLCLAAKGRSTRAFKDVLPRTHGPKAELCVFAASTDGSVARMDSVYSARGPLGACAKYFGPVGGCSFSNDIHIRAAGSRASIMSRPHYGESTLSCTAPASGTLTYASTGFSIPLSPSGFCHLDLGSGLGVGHRVSVQSAPVPVRVSCSIDLPVASTGLHKGSGVIVFTAD